MPQIEVRRLHYKGAAALAGRVEHAIGDALRTETTDDGRLILVRRLPLGRIGFGERGATRAAATAWRELVGAARHGGESGAESANCVWFASPAEARTLILRELALGRTPFAWFWALAVPGWRRMTLAQYLDHRLELALVEPSGVAIAALVDEALAADAPEALATAILAKMPAGRSAIGPSAEPTLPRSAEGSERAGAEPEAGEADEVERMLALGLLRTVPPLLHAVLEQLAARSGAAPLIQALARGLVRRLHPALALAPARLERIALLVVRLLRTGDSRSARRSGNLSRDRSSAAPAAAADAAPQTSRSDRPPDDEVHGQAIPTASDAPPDLPTTRQDHVERPPLPESRELATSAAGVILALVPLIRLGWREWLAGRPEWLLYQPGARLLQAIAAHHRVPPDDPIWSALPQVDREIEAPAALEAALGLWRKGLDGWLRRTARLNLAQLVLRRGWLLPGPDTTIVRFPLDGIDIRLRRLALDGDPGWVDWLGHSYRLVYRDRPLTGPQAS